MCPKELRNLVLTAERENCSDEALCMRCAEDQRFLRSNKRPGENRSGNTIFAGDLFAGCGGMSIGLTEAARRLGHNLEVSLAVDSDDEVLKIYRHNLPTSATRRADVAELFDGAIGAPMTIKEQALAGCAPIDILLGGPPCQGHSDLNNHTRRNDPKNALYLRMGRAAELLKPKVVVIENVATVKWDESRVAERTMDALRVLGYSVTAEIVDLRNAGVPQRRRRFVLLASRVNAIEPEAVFEGIRSSWQAHRARTVRWAIHDLLDVEASTPFDTASARSRNNVNRMGFLFKHGLYDLPNNQRPECHRDGNHSYRSVYGRLRWTEPAQTITTGFGSMGQGRYVHPQRRRTLTPHEAARLQTFPDWFDFGKETRRGVLAKAIGNAVPPFLTLQIGQLILPSLATIKMQK